jgi:sterol desaturase/sphingolipid hydroxylase (fatty acid hydroxylase superfamily)
MIIFAQGLHLWLYGWKRQGDDFKYDRRGPARNARTFLWNDQYWDNITYALLSGVTIWTFYDVIVWIGYANGWAPMITMQSNPIWFFTLFLFLPLIQSFHFYWIHRGLHIPFFYKRVHSVHHRSVSVAPWSGFSMHPIEHFFYMSLLLIFLVIPAHPIHFIFMGYSLVLATATSHAGFEDLVLGERAHLKIGSFHHQLHHRYFECNYGGPEMPWDNWFGSFHDGSPEATQRVRDTKKRMHGK